MTGRPPGDTFAGKTRNYETVRKNQIAPQRSGTVPRRIRGEAQCLTSGDHQMGKRRRAPGYRQPHRALAHVQDKHRRSSLRGEGPHGEAFPL